MERVFLTLVGGQVPVVALSILFHRSIAAHWGRATIT